MTPSLKKEPEWMEILRADVAASGSIAATAIRIGVARSGLSAILNATPSSPYANGKASTAKMAERVMNTIGMVVCPFLSEYRATEHRITGLQCREHAYRANPPTNSPREMQHWRACQSCDKRVKAAPPEEVKPGRKTVAKMRPAAAREAVAAARPKGEHAEPIQQAGIVDTVTLPLPEVGGPQIAEKALP